MTALWLLALGALLAQILAALAVAWNWRHAPDIAAEPPLAIAGPRVLALVPARNEEANIGACVAALRLSTYPRLRVRVIDDGSSDRTAALARAAGAEVIAAGELPPGWLGKNHALWVGAQGATEEFLLLVDADLRVAPDCVARMVGAAERARADLLSIVPRVETVTFWERAAQALVAQIIYAWLPAREVNDPRKRAAAATGPCMLFRRSAYEQIGGHQAVRGEVVEDLRLAEAVKRARLRLVYGRGVALASLRMYDSLGAIVRGWSKNFHVALAGALWLAPPLALALLLAYAGPWLLVPLAAVAGAWRALALALGATLVAVVARRDASRRYGIDGAVWLAPLGAGVVAFILLRSALQAAARRPFVWKGRSVS
jgi:cellulose synthase/poly-beta-1,6-N-acetylglucosamine synthase-like glycosyltransferase